MEQPKYYSVSELLTLIDEPNGSICRRIVEENVLLFSTAPGSAGKHQAWRGGYLDHIIECMNQFILLYEFEKLTKRDLPFSLSDGLLVIFLHDLEKPWKYSQHVQHLLNTKHDRKIFREQKIREYGIQLTPEQFNALTYIEGENDVYSDKRVMNELCAFCHVADILSARAFHDYPRTRDPWKGAERFARNE